MATFGNTAADAGNSSSSTDKIAVSTATPATAGTITDGVVRVKMSTTGGSSGTRIVVYSDSTGAPNTLLAVSDEFVLTSTVVASVPYTFSGINQIAVTASTPYWIGLAWQASAPGITLYRNSVASGRIEQTYTYPSVPSSFGTGSVLTGPIDVYVNYTEAGTVTPASFSTALMMGI